MGVADAPVTYFATFAKRCTAATVLVDGLRSSCLSSATSRSNATLFLKRECAAEPGS